jgi:hypothetical protein
MTNGIAAIWKVSAHQRKQFLDEETAHKWKKNLSSYTSDMILNPEYVKISKTNTKRTNNPINKRAN